MFIKSLHSAYTCSDCGYSYTAEPTAAAGHSYDEEKITPTCTAEGYIIYTCSICCDSYIETIPVLDHSYSTQWTVDKEATCKETGSKSHHCTVCGEKTDETVTTKLPHTYETVTTAPTCTADGFTTHTCTACGASYKDEIKKATGHIDGDGDGVCDVCKANIPSAPAPGDCTCGCHKSGFGGFIWKIACFFYKLFGMKQYRSCACGNVHW